MDRSLVATSRSATGNETRARILASARRLLADGGSANFTTRRVAALANVSHGMCHYHFATKRDLILALIDVARADWVGPLEKLVAGPEPAVARAHRLIEWIAQPATSEVMRVHQAIYSFALDDEAVRKRLADEYARWRKPFIALFTQLADELDLQPFDAESIGASFATAADGFVQQQVLDPDLTTSSYLERLLDRLTHSKKRL